MALRTMFTGSVSLASLGALLPVPAKEARMTVVKSKSGHRTAAGRVPADPRFPALPRRAVGGINAVEGQVAGWQSMAASRRRIWTAKPSALKHRKTLVAKFTDGPLAGSTRDVTAVEGRPPKTIDVDFADRRVRYCLAEWEQSGHSAIYGYLYDV